MVHAVLGDRTFIPARVSFGVFYLTQCLNVHHRYCGSESPAALTPTPSITAVLCCQLSAAAGFPPQQLLRCLCAFPCQRVVLAGGKGLCLSWVGKALGQERGCCQCPPPALTGFYLKLIWREGVQVNKIHIRNIRSFS